VIEHFNRYFQDNYSNFPAFFVDTLAQALNEALHLDAVEDVRLVLLFSWH
jgi:hypothetical protein